MSQESPTQGMRGAWLVSGLLLLALVWTPQVFWPTDPSTVSAAQGGLLLGALWGLVRWKTSWSPKARVLRALLALVGGLLSAFIGLVLTWMHACAYLVAALVSIPMAIGLGTLHGLTFFGLLWRYWRRPADRPRSAIWLASLVFVGSLHFVAWAAWMWSPPSVEVCRAVADAEGVTRLSPEAWPQEPSHPYDLLYIEEEGWLVAAFKMAGNGALAFWDNHDANRVLAVNVQDPTQRAVLPMSGRPLPQYMTYAAKSRELLVSRMGPVTSILDVVDLTRLPELVVARSREVPFSSHEVVSHPERPVFGVFGDHGEFFEMDRSTLGLSEMTQLEKEGDHGAVTLNAWHRPGSNKVYVNFLLYPLAEIDIDTREVRWTDVLFGGGQLTGLDARGELFQSDMLLNHVDVIDLERLELSRRLEVDFAPRPLVVDAARDLLVVGGWLDGEVHFFRLSDLKPLGARASVGPYLRDFAYDAQRGHLFAGSKCGVFQIPVDPLIED